VLFRRGPGFGKIPKTLTLTLTETKAASSPQTYHATFTFVNLLLGLKREKSIINIARSKTKIEVAQGDLLL